MTFVCIVKNFILLGLGQIRVIGVLNRILRDNGKELPALSQENGNEWDPYIWWTFTLLNIGSIVRIVYTIACFVYRLMNGAALDVTPTTELHVD